MKLATVILLALLGSAAAASASDNPAELQKQLEELENEIREFRQLLEETRGERADLEKLLQDNEKEISDIIRRIEQIQQDLSDGKDKVSALQREEQALDRARAGQQQLIKQQIRAAFEIGRQDYLKVVLNQEDPNRLARMLTYYDYFNRARADQIAAWRHTIASLQEVSREIKAQNETLAERQEDLEQRHAALQAARQEKQTTLTALNEAIAGAGAALEIRQKDRERLEALLERITAGVVNLPTPADTVAFAARKGELLMPVAGKVTNRFGSPRNDGKLRWNGVFIEAAAGTPVIAVHYGRVVFSDWLRGFGLLLIVSHGDGFMSLYGHNEVLYRETGDWVSAGETIATVGDTGGMDRSGVYFEIRQAGKPTDPQNWCRARPVSDSPANSRSNA